ncbi:MAG: LPP20 family lipoprotein [Culturomica sp.]|jgi:hypothetical protein|nr:LPP20 family lipoprotein [Culturomica sp.]
MLKKILLVVLVLWGGDVFPQAVEDIKRNSDYFWGEGVSSSTKKAEDEAIGMILNSISTTVVSRSFVDTEEKVVNDKTDFNQTAKFILESYSTATLRNVTRLGEWMDDNGDSHVFCYIKKSEVNKIFAEREAKIKDFIATGLETESKLQLADALKYYYWALMLLKSHPEGVAMTGDIAGRQQILSTFLPQRINEVLDGISLRVTGKKSETNLTIYNLAFTFKGKPVSNLEYKFHNGRSYSPTTSAQNGIGTAELGGVEEGSVKDIQLLVEYEFGDEWKADKTLEDVMNKLDPVKFKSALKKTSIVPQQVEEFKPEVVTIASSVVSDDFGTPTKEKSFVGAVDGSSYSDLLGKVQQAIASKQYDAASDCFTPEGYEMYKKLVGRGKAVICGSPDYRFIAFENGVFARSLPMRFTFTNRRSFVEDVVFEIDTLSKKIRSLSFAVNDNVASTILDNKAWNNYSRLAIINFIETYKTAYALERLDFLESVFSDSALIIVGRVVRPTYTIESRRVPQEIAYNTLSKDKYMRNLERCFRDQEYINLKFTDTEIKRAAKGGEIYGIQMQQEYFSTTYSDKGYLFLYVDLNDVNKPIIHVRTWQPEKDTNLGLFNLGNLGM